MLHGKMLIEVRKAGFVNKGAELMLYAVMEKVKQEFPNAKFAMEPSRGTTPYEKRALLGFYQKPRFFRSGIQFGQLFNYTPNIVREMLGIVTDNQIDIIIDAAGFSYSDQWGLRSSQELANSCKRWKYNGTKIILMPQAFGPFTSQPIRKAIKEAAKHADLIFAREITSYNHLIDITGKKKNINIAPDFTNLIDGILPDDFDIKANRICLVPNYRMIDKTSKDQSDFYLPFMIKCARYLVELKAKPFILVHEGANDAMLAQQISDAVGGIPVIKETNPLKIKGILGTCEATIGSRFHGLVSALSQGVPSLATGWSHKYLHLFEDYGFPDGVVSVLDTEDTIKAKIDLIIQPDKAQALRKQLNDKSEQLKQHSEEMWKIIFGMMGSK